MNLAAPETPGATGRLSGVAEVFGAFLLLGCTSFGGPVAHLGYFREAFVVRRGWLTDSEYADLVSLCQFLPGPSSSQVGIAIGLARAGYAGAVAAWVAFTLPSVVLLLAFAWGLGLWQGAGIDGALHGLKIAALAVVALAVWQMSRTLTPDRPRQLIALGCGALLLLFPGSLAQIGVLAAAALAGSLQSGPHVPPATATAPHKGSRRVGAIWLLAFAVILAGLPLLAAATGDSALALADRFYRTGALVFGGGHVVLPLLQAQLVDPGLIDQATFVAGYGAAQAVPGPLFSFAAFAGAMLTSSPNGLAGAALALGAIYLPSFLLVLGAVPFWQRMRHMARLRAALDYANAAVLGLLLAALYDPVFISAVSTPRDLALALVALAALGILRWPPWLVVIVCALAGLAMA